MDANRMLHAHNASRKFLGYPKVTVIIDSSQWTIPSDVHKDPVYDGWYNDNNDPVDPAEFWETTEIEVSLSISESTDKSFVSVGERDESTISYYTIIDNKDVVKTAYGFIVDGDVYKLDSLNILPMPSKGVIIDFRIKKWD